ncbi:MAG: thioredoxin family protein [Verrucomicrobia bacterium]|nr:thioredoxin family protein [Verrucomicrobiota bacterium]MCH8527030.1 thioredoxin family protein [Kiritimatiellia bacterium]
MKTLLYIFALIAATALSRAQEPMRTWTNQDGRTLEAKMLSADGVQATVMTADARVLNLQLDTLSNEDQAYVREKRGGSPGLRTAQAGPRKAEWIADGDAALKDAKDLKLPVLLLFTGSDWCPPCMRLEREVFEKEAFKEFANENLVLQIADFPRRRRLSQKQQAANQALAQKFGIRGYPTMVLLDAEGNKIDQFGYGGQDAARFVSMLEGKLN